MVKSYTCKIPLGHHCVRLHNDTLHTIHTLPQGLKVTPVKITDVKTPQTCLIATVKVNMNYLKGVTKRLTVYSVKFTFL